MELKIIRMVPDSSTEGGDEQPSFYVKVGEEHLLGPYYEQKAQAVKKALEDDEVKKELVLDLSRKIDEAIKPKPGLKP